MVNHKSKAKATATVRAPAQTQRLETPLQGVYSPKAGFFPFARYTSVVGVHTTLLAFTALFLPRTTLLFQLATYGTDPSQMTSRDRPQHPFMEALTLNPVSTLTCICAGSVVLQAWWGGWLRDWSIEYVLEGSIDEKRTGKALSNQLRTSGVRDAWLATFAASLALHAVLVLFGAPITSLGLCTYLLALLISILTVFPPIYTLGLPSFSNDSHAVVDRLNWVRLFAEFSIRTPIERALVYPAIGTAIGCWLGIIPIALDWDRPWQAWPLTPTFGAILGYIISSIYALTASGARYFADEHIRSQQIKKKTS